MAKLIDDPKVQDLLAKEKAKADKAQQSAVKAETKRVLDIVKATITEAINEAKEAGEKGQAKNFGNIHKQIVEASKAPF